MATSTSGQDRDADGQSSRYARRSRVVISGPTGYRLEAIRAKDGSADARVISRVQVFEAERGSLDREERAATGYAELVGRPDHLETPDWPGS